MALQEMKFSLQQHLLEMREIRKENLEIKQMCLQLQRQNALIQRQNAQFQQQMRSIFRLVSCLLINRLLLERKLCAGLFLAQAVGDHGAGSN